MDFLVAAIGLLAGALLGYFGERLRRKQSLIDHRLDTVDEALIILSKLSARFLHDPMSAMVFYFENAGIMSAGSEAAAALGAVALHQRTGEARDLLASLKQSARQTSRVGVPVPVGLLRSHHRNDRSLRFRFRYG